MISRKETIEKLNGIIESEDDFNSVIIIAMKGTKLGQFVIGDLPRVAMMYKALTDDFSKLKGLQKTIFDAIQKGKIVSQEEIENVSNSIEDEFDKTLSKIFDKYLKENL